MKWNIFFLFLLLCFSFQTITFSKDTSSIPFPKIELLKMDSVQLLENKDIDENKTTIFINFSPTCDHCTRTIENILENINLFKETQFILSSFEDFSSIRKFYFDNFLSSYTNVFIGQEIGYSLTKQIKYASFPSLVLFDKQKKWITTIPRETNTKTILKLLNKKKK